MDLRYRGAPLLAERFLRVYAAERDDFDLYRVVDWFESYRAAVRAKVAAIAAGEAGDLARRSASAPPRARAAISRWRWPALEARRAPALVLVGGAVGTRQEHARVGARGPRSARWSSSSDRVRKHASGLARRGARARRAPTAPRPRRRSTGRCSSAPRP